MKKLMLSGLILMAVWNVAAAADLILAGNGRSDYRIAAPPHANEMERLAVADLAMYLKRITGADFTGTDAKYTIHVGKAAPSDKKPLRPNERRVRSENGDLHTITLFEVYSP